MIGEGGFSYVWKYNWRQGSTIMEVAVKCPKHVHNEMDIAKARKMLKREFRTLHNLNHPNILPLIGLTYQFGPMPCLVMPWMNEGALTDFLSRNHDQLTMEHRFIILREIASGLRYLHRSGVIHGDLTGANVLLDQSGRICISDFGLAFGFIESDESMATPTHVCAPRWAAPELFIHPDLERSRPIPTTSSDVYSFGCIVWQVLSGEIPFSHIIKSTHVIILKYEGKDPLDERPSTLATRHWDFLQSTWSKEPEMRPSSDDALAFMQGEIERFSRHICKL